MTDSLGNLGVKCGRCGSTDCHFDPCPEHTFARAFHCFGCGAIDRIRCPECEPEPRSDDWLCNCPDPDCWRLASVDVCPTCRAERIWGATSAEGSTPNTECSKCGAVAYGNALCVECHRHWSWHFPPGCEICDPAGSRGEA